MAFRHDVSNRYRYITAEAGILRSTVMVETTMWRDTARIAIAILLLVTIWVTLNWVVQVARKPSEIFFPVSGSLSKSPAQTWRQHGSLFTTHSTSVITPELLASLAQVESNGNPLA